VLGLVLRDDSFHRFYYKAHEGDNRQVLADLVAVILVVVLRFGSGSRNWTTLFLDPGSGAYSPSRLQFYEWAVTLLFAYAYVCF
jgi:hypothetical protein